MPVTDHPPQHRARKRFGQNFLTSEALVQRIVRSIAPRSGDCLIEIGPGQGALTGPLRALLDELYVVEIDRDLAAALRARSDPGLHVIEQDALALHLPTLMPGRADIRIAGNLPYNISTPLLFHLLEQRALIRDMHFLLQREVVDRMAAAPGSGEYGRLSVMLQYCCEVEPLFQVPPEAFRPRPRVQSRLVRLVPRAPEVVARDHALLGSLVKTAFGMRRKTLRNALRNLVGAETIQAAGLAPGLRPEQLSVADWVSLANAASQGDEE